MTSKITVPKAMLHAAEKLIPHTGHGYLSTVLQAALTWLTENPMVPTTEQNIALYESRPLDVGHTGWAAVEWQRRMFLDPDPEVPEPVKDLLYDPKDGPTQMSRNDAVIEAFKRGRAHEAERSTR